MQYSNDLCMYKNSISFFQGVDLLTDSKYIIMNESTILDEKIFEIFLNLL